MSDSEQKRVSKRKTTKSKHSSKSSKKLKDGSNNKSRKKRKTEKRVKRSKEDRQVKHHHRNSRNPEKETIDNVRSTSKRHHSSQKREHRRHRSQKEKQKKNKSRKSKKSRIEIVIEEDIGMNAEPEDIHAIDQNLSMDKNEKQRSDSCSYSINNDIEHHHQRQKDNRYSHRSFSRSFSRSPSYYTSHDRYRRSYRRERRDSHRRYHSSYYPRHRYRYQRSRSRSPSNSRERRYRRVLLRDSNSNDKEKETEKGKEIENENTEKSNNDVQSTPQLFSDPANALNLFNISMRPNLLQQMLSAVQGQNTNNNNMINNPLFRSLMQLNANLQNVTASNAISTNNSSQSMINPLFAQAMAAQIEQQQQRKKIVNELSTNDVSSEIKKDENEIDKETKSVKKKTIDSSLFFTMQLPGINNSIPVIGGIHPQITRPSRRLYVGNLPVGMGLNECILCDFFAQCCKGLGIATVNPVLSVWLNSEQTFGFIEFRSVPDTTLALTLFEGLQLGGRQLRFGRPVDYKPPPINLQDYMVGTSINGGTINTNINTNNNNTTTAIMAQMQQNQQLAMLGSLSNIAQTQNAKQNLQSAMICMAEKHLKEQEMKDMMDVDDECTSVLCLLNMIQVSGLKNDEEYADILEDIQLECSDFGDVLQVIIPRIGECGQGRVFVQFAKTEHARECFSKVDGRTFDNNIVKAFYYNIAKFEARELDADVDESLS